MYFPSNMIHETSENKVMLEFLNLLAVQESVSCKKYEHFKVNMQHVGDMDGAMTFSENKGITHVLGVLSRERDLLNSGNRKR